jgi:hypothetical protein
LIDEKANEKRRKYFECEASWELENGWTIDERWSSNSKLKTDFDLIDESVMNRRWHV